jgi:release factor glutamine methyltransferase
MVTDSLDSRLLLQHVLGVSHAAYLRAAPITLSDTQQTDYAALLARRALGEPVAKIIGEKAFWKHCFFTNQHTLDPRPESEHIIEAVLHHRPDVRAPYRILDCGTGTGCLLLSLLHEYSEAYGVGVDISQHAITTATQNATRLHLKKRADFQHLPWTEACDPVYDIVVSNPPYIPSCDMLTLHTDVVDYDPHMALDGGIDGLDAYRDLFAHMQHMLKHGGLFVCEIGIGQEADVLAIGIESGMFYQATVHDLAGIPRTLVWERPQ